MITIKNWDKEIERAKEEVIRAKKDAWVQEYINKHKIIDPGAYPIAPNIEVKAWFIGQWDTGFVCVAMDELMKLSKKQRDKIFKLGGIHS